ncbi:carbohydrate-binding protein [Acinetobacter sp. NRRL B-65365]|uniref:phage nozzle protein n=1 Tax=Acinetobacter sp. NRRL B-65365 TaxID=1785092 RepID=UPI00079FD65C|nr:carbohydrate-binding protein [Acinetobacter sp. NRRL B-65365]KYQ83562.1 carbohydrate-binding protein [Acinetobacter sp. NRRL B-65365]
MKQFTIKNNFSAGELSPLLGTRTDIQQYSNGAKELFNVIPLIEGGFKKRPGTKFRLDTQALRLIPFIPKSKNPFLIMLGIGKMWIYNPRTHLIEKEFNTPYDTAQKVEEVQVAHTRYRMFFVQGDTPVHRLVTSKVFDTWQFGAFVFNIAPLDDEGRYPNVALTPSGVEVGMTVTLSAASYPTWDAETTYITDDRVIFASKTYKALTESKGKQPDEVGSLYWEEVTGSAANIFTSEDIDSIVTLNGGQVQITSIDNPSVARGIVMVKLTSDIQAIAKSWHISAGAFSDEKGYPRAVSFFKQRLVFANTDTSPNLIWFSAIADDGNFLTTSDDSDAISMASSSAQSDNILFLVQRGGVAVLTGGAEFIVSSTGAFTPSTAQIEEQTAYGCHPDVRPCRVGNEVLYVQRGGARLRAMSYDYTTDGLVSDDLTAIAPHIAKDQGGFAEITYQQTPDSIVWCVLNNGTVAALTYNKAQAMAAWSHHDFGGNVISMCSIPTNLGDDQCFMLVVRNGVTVLEELSENSFSDCEIDKDFNGNTALVPNIGLLSNPIASFSNNDGRFYTDVTVNGLVVKLNSSLNQLVHLGNHFVCRAALYPPNLAQAPATVLHDKLQLNSVFVFLYESLGGEVINCDQPPQPLQYKNFDQSVFQNKPFTGYAEITLKGWETVYDFTLQITHDKPLPFYVQAISSRISINER